MNINKTFYQIQFNKGRQIDFLTQLSHLVEAGVPAPDALQYIRQICKEKNDRTLFMVVDQMCHNTAEGKKIAEDMQDWFPYEVCTILIRSEERGFLQQGLKNILEYMNSNRNFFAPLTKMTSGLVYLIATLIAITIIGYVYLPQIGQYSKEWPPISKALYSLSSFFYHQYYLIILVLIALLIWIRRATYYYNRKFYQCIAIPFMSIYKARLAYFILKTFALLSANGIGVPEIINQLSKTYTTGFLADQLRQMHHKLSGGEQNMGNVMDTGLFTSRQINELHLISRFVSEENYSRIFSAMSSIIAAQIIKLFSRIAVVVNLVCMVLTGACILWIYGAYALLASSIH